MNFVVFMTGDVACLKTTIAGELARELGIPLLATHTFGEIIGKRKLSVLYKRNKRYELMFESLEALLSKGKSVVLDGTFCRKSWRNKLIKICKNYKVKELIAIRCICSDESLVKSRLNKRKFMTSCPEHHCNSFKDYLHDKNLMQYPSELFLQSNFVMLHVDTKDMTSWVSNNTYPPIGLITKSLKKVLARIPNDDDYMVIK